MANASLLDEATAAAEAMHMCVEAHGRKRKAFVVDAATHPQTIAVVATRARPLGIEVRTVARAALAAAVAAADVAACCCQYPTTDGTIHDDRALIASAHAAGVKVVVAADLLALTAAHAPRASSAPTSRSARASASACRWASAARTRRSWPPPTTSAA
jgi:glycine dehydrogenase